MLLGGALAGRERELDVLLARLAALRSGRPGFVAIAGEAGIGKTRLLDELVLRLDERRESFVRGCAREIERQVPFALAIDALDEQIGAWDRARRDRAEPPAELAGVFPSLSGSWGAGEATPLQRAQRHQAVRWVLEEIAGTRPLVLVLDDVHWADDASVGLIAHLLRRPLTRPVLLVVAYRPDCAPAPLLRAVQTAAREGLLNLLEPQALALEEADALLDPALSLSARRRLVADSGGNPFYLTQLALTHGGLEPQTNADVPDAVRVAVSRELERVAPQARRLLRAAAVLGDHFDLDVAAEVAGLGELEALEALDEQIAGDRLRPTDRPRRFAFRQPIVRQAVYAGSGEGWRLAAHERAIAALSARRESALVVAHHVERCAGTGGEGSVELLLEAAELAAPQSPSTAARYLDAALRFARGALSADRQLELVLARTAALSRAGRLGEAGDALRELLAALPSGPGETRARIVVMLAEIEAGLGGRASLGGLLRDALEGSGVECCHLRAELALTMAADCLRSEHVDEARRWAHDALEAVSDSDDRRSRARSAALLALIESAGASVASGRRHAADAARIVDDLLDRDLDDRLTGLFHLAAAEVALGEFQAGLRHARRGLAIASASGQLLQTASFAFVVGRSQLSLGRLEEAADCATTLLELARTLGNDQCAMWGHTLLACTALHRGDVSDAVREAERAVRCAERAPRALFAMLSHYVAADAYLASGEPEQAREHLLARGGGPDLPLVQPGLRARCYEVLVDAELGLGRPAHARRWVQCAAQAVEEGAHQQPAGRAAAHRAHAAVLLAEGQAAEAAAVARSAAEGFAVSGFRVEAARALTLAGRAFVAAGEPQRAIVALESAHRELDARGAWLRRDEAARELRRLAHRVPRRGHRGAADGTGVATLSARQREVADLVAQGKTNKQIGAALFVSGRTVENHLAQIFQKLGVSSRAEVAREVSLAHEDGPEPLRSRRFERSLLPAARLSAA